MSNIDNAGLYRRLGTQSLGRKLTEAEGGLAAALEEIFAGGCHDLVQVADALRIKSVPRPSSDGGDWTVEILERELSLINRSLDEAYVASGGIR